MKIECRPCESLLKAAQLTYKNMYPYYQRYAPGWDVEKILEVTQPLRNFDLVFDGKGVGVMRLEFEATCCWLRDLQVSEHFQSKGIGKAALDKAKSMTRDAGVDVLKLRVLKTSPAVSLYERQGFATHSEDDKFFNMQCEVV